ncbi:MAG: creatininase family protein [Halobacteriales archaeon]|nr:creatininase family protein [Halobacteriales archaeon]
MNLEEMNWTEVRDSPPDVVLLPVGSTEQHGPHAPLSTDALIAENVAHETAEKTDACLCLPTVPVGVSEEHRGFDGTLYVSPSTFRAYVAETLRSAPADHAVVVNGHGGNIDALHETCARLTREDGAPFATYWTWWEAVEKDALEMGHAGAVETSVLLHLAPELVGEAVEGADSWGEYAEGAPLTYDSDDFTENGVVGDATEASEEEGARLYEEAVESLVRLVETVAEA